MESLKNNRAPLFTDKVMRAVAHARGFESQYVEIKGCRLHYLEKSHGDDSPTIVLIHGISAAGVHYAKIMQPLYDLGYNIVAPDLPSHGFSQSPAARPLTAALAYDFLEAFLDQVVRGRFILIGNSLGGALSVRYAIHRPERLNALVAISPAGGFADHGEWDAFRNGLLLETRKDAVSFMERLYARMPWYAPLISGVLLRGFQRDGIRDLLKTTTFEDFAESSGVPGLKPPVLLIWGQDDHIFPAKNLEWFRANLPARAVVETPEGVGHCPQLDSADWLVGRLSEYFKRIGAWHGAGTEVSLRPQEH